MAGAGMFGDQLRAAVRPVPPEERPYAMALCALPGIGPVRARRLRDLAGGYRAAWDSGPEALSRFAASGVRHGPELAKAWRSLRPAVLWESLDGLGISAAFEGDDGYPCDLLEVRAPPLVVYIRGKIAAGDRPAVALVGTRRMSAYGQWMSLQLASALAGRELTVVSGLARGIDSAAHRGALEAGGRTLAVLPGGLDVVYPPEHAGLAGEIAAQGALVSEHLPGTPVLPGSFPARNRLIAGIAAATVVVEAGVRSGALITAHFALELGREVLAVPGKVGAPGSGGVHALLKDGAGLVEGADDIIAALPERARAVVRERARPAGSGRDRSQGGGGAEDRRTVISSRTLEDRLLGLLRGGPLTEKEIIGLSAAAAEKVRATLVMLEMEDRVQRLPGAVYAARDANRR